MKKIVVIGSGIGGVRALEEVRAVDKESEMTLLCNQPSLPVRPDLFFDFISQTVDLKGILYQPEEFYKNNRITPVLDQDVDKISFSRKSVTTKEKEKVSFDILVISDIQETQFPDIKGINKAGVFGFRTFKDIQEISSGISLVETVAIQSNSLEGLKLASAVRKRGKEAIVVTGDDHLLADTFDQQASQFLSHALEEEGIEIFTSSSVEEVIGNGDMKAVRLKSGKVIACQMLIFADAQPDFKKFTEAPFEISRGICVDAHFKTKADNIYALGLISQVSGQEHQRRGELSVSDLEKQGQALGANIAGQDKDYQKSVSTDSWKLANLSIVRIGHTSKSSQIRDLSRIDVDSKVYKRIFVENDIPVGAILCNAEAEQDRILRLIEEGASLAGQDQEIWGENCDSGEIQQLTG